MASRNPRKGEIEGTREEEERPSIERKEISCPLSRRSRAHKKGKKRREAGKERVLRKKAASKKARASSSWREREERPSGAGGKNSTIREKAKKTGGKNWPLRGERGFLLKKFLRGMTSEKKWGRKERKRYQELRAKEGEKA